MEGPLKPIEIKDLDMENLKKTKIHGKIGISRKVKLRAEPSRAYQGFLMVPMFI